MIIVEELLKDAIEQKDTRTILKLMKDNYPIDIALALAELDEDLIKKFMFMISNKRLASILEVATPDMQRLMMEKLPFRRVHDLFLHMSNDDIVDILGNLPVGIRKKYLGMMKKGNQNQIQHMLNYDPHSAGGIMTTDFITLKEHLTITQTFDKLREISPNTEMINVLFITGQDNTLLGWIDIRDLFLYQETETLKQLMHTQLITVTPEIDQEEVAQLSSKYDLSVVPVVNSKGILLGIITSDDIMDVLQEEHKEDMLRMSGVQETEVIGGPFVESVKKRIPWLLINLITAFLASSVVAAFDETIQKVVLLAVAAPIITGMGGNSASQTLALAIQSLTLGTISLKEDKHLVWKEISLGLVNGLITGLVAATGLFLVYQNFYLSLIVVLAMMINLMFGGIFGYFVPLVLKALKLDPALASTIFVTTATDVLGYFAFLGLAQLMLPLLI